MGVPLHLSPTIRILKLLCRSLLVLLHSHSPVGLKYTTMFRLPHQRPQRSSSCGFSTLPPTKPVRFLDRLGGEGPFGGLKPYYAETRKLVCLLCRVGDEGD